MVMQALLRAAHFTDKKGRLLGIDGQYGPKTQQAVDSFHAISYQYAGRGTAGKNQPFNLDDWYSLLGIEGVNDA